MKKKFNTANGEYYNMPFTYSLFMIIAQQETTKKAEQLLKCTYFKLLI